MKSIFNHLLVCLCTADLSFLITSFPRTMDNLDMLGEVDQVSLCFFLFFYFCFQLSIPKCLIFCLFLYISLKLMKGLICKMQVWSWTVVPMGYMNKKKSKFQHYCLNFYPEFHTFFWLVFLSWQFTKNIPILKYYTFHSVVLQIT